MYAPHRVGHHITASSPSQGGPSAVQRLQPLVGLRCSYTRSNDLVAESCLPTDVAARLVLPPHLCAAGMRQPQARPGYAANTVETSVSHIPLFSSILDLQFP